MEDLKNKYNYDDCKCCDNCNYWEWKDERMERTVCNKLGIETTDEGHRVCDLWEEVK